MVHSQPLRRLTRFQNTYQDARLLAKEGAPVIGNAELVALQVKAGR
jgi:hypothetical protein